MTETVEERIARVAFTADGLVAAIVQQWDTREVLMLGLDGCRGPAPHAHQGRVTFWSRSRQEYWRKGDTSGQHPARARRAPGLRRRRDPARGRPGRPRVPHRHPHLLRRRRPRPRARARAASAVIRRARLLAVARDARSCGALGVISSTQTWLIVVLDDGARHELDGRRRGRRSRARAAQPRGARPRRRAVDRRPRAAVRLRRAHRRDRGAARVPERAGRVRAPRSRPSRRPSPTATGITGAEAVAALVAAVAATPWPALTLVASRSCCSRPACSSSSTARALARERAPIRVGCRDPPPKRQPRHRHPDPYDAIDSWDDLSRGADPTRSHRRTPLDWAGPALSRRKQ